jgi:hypothetical protein
MERTEGTETSKYLQEEKSTEIPLVAASERRLAQTSMLKIVHVGVVGLSSRGRVAKENVWEVTPKRVKVSYRKR